MRIFISADWHLGKRLHQEDLSEDMELFFAFLLEKIREEETDYLLIAGDIFDQHNPAHEATRQYYRFLSKLNATGCKAIIIAGNHDSPSFLDTPSSLLSNFGVTVVAQFPGLDKINQVFIPVEDKRGKNKAIVAAIPFLQDRFIRQVGEGESSKTIDEKIQEGMRNIFRHTGEALRRDHPGLTHIGMAHLHAQGMQVSEAERDIQIGNVLGITADALNQFDYLGLGHIHTGQAVLEGRIHYASSPISLGFSENNYAHKIIRLELEDGQITQSFIPIPKTRSLYQVKGSLVEVEQKLNSLRCKYQLPVLLDIAIEETTYKPAVMEAIAAWRETLPARNIRLIQQRVTYLDRINNSRTSALQAERVHDLQPEVVFSSLIKEREDDAEKTAIMELFQSILSDLTR
ncbi:MAG: exonuclease subunit SbcD [Bacteroidota bacterium]|jgi:exonuclease SbcD